MTNDDLHANDNSSSADGREWADPVASPHAGSYITNDGKRRSIRTSPIKIIPTLPNLNIQTEENPFTIEWQLLPADQLDNELPFWKRECLKHPVIAYNEHGCAIIPDNGLILNSHTSYNDKHAMEFINFLPIVAANSGYHFDVLYEPGMKVDYPGPRNKPTFSDLSLFKKCMKHWHHKGIDIGKESITTCVCDLCQKNGIMLEETNSYPTTQSQVVGCLTSPTFLSMFSLMKPEVYFNAVAPYVHCVSHHRDWKERGYEKFLKQLQVVGDMSCTGKTKPSGYKLISDCFGQYKEKFQRECLNKTGHKLTLILRKDELKVKDVVLDSKLFPARSKANRGTLVKEKDVGFKPLPLYKIHQNAMIHYARKDDVTLPDVLKEIKAEWSKKGNSAFST